eukprot:TRINITY_DN1411_c0_g1_i1.p1 TRINITY_DN1411_c0_g1~~TRINITY_DN1411_c0_g1_i1.p1  ORF type:complete len:355 (-),score=85.20 TRINITY_DN1411_c0_g1_i1:71-1135(-)
MFKIARCFSRSFSTCRAVTLKGFGKADMMQVSHIPVPVPQKGEVLIEVAATSVNRPDLVQREGKYPPPKGDSEILGLEVSGTIAKMSDDVKAKGKWKEGDRVMALVGGGGYAEYCRALENHLMPIPSSLSYEEAACVNEAYITAFLNVFQVGGINHLTKGKGQSLLAHGGGGGVNTAAVQLVRALAPECQLLVTCSPAKMEDVRKLGVGTLIDYTDPKSKNFSEIVRKATNDKGVTAILDHIGAKYLDQNIKSLAYAGRLVIIGITSGAKAELNLGLLMVKRQQIIGSVLRSRPVKDKAELISQFQKIALPKFADRSIVPQISKVFSLDQVVEAHRMMEADKHFGKIVLSMKKL